MSSNPSYSRVGRSQFLPVLRRSPGASPAAGDIQSRSVLDGVKATVAAALLGRLDAVSARTGQANIAGGG